MKFEFRSLVTWPFPETDSWERRSRYTFKAAWSDTLWLLEREIDNLEGERCVIQAGFRDGDIRLDGLPRADARVPAFPGIIVSFESRVGPLQYATDTHEYWQHNVRAIALGLEALRAVDRYGITRSNEQYQGWKMLTAGSGVTSRQKAIDLIAGLCQVMPHAVAEDPGTYYRQALKIAHPDHGGDVDVLSAVRDAGRLLGVTS